MRESIFTGKVPITCPDEDIPWQMKCDVVRTDDRVEIRLIDMRDIFTFYLSVISHSDFYLMKKEQDIIVDYDRFISVLVKMFHGLQNGRLTGIFSKDTNKFLFVEDDEFRNIVRLELQFSKPNESHYKMYLGDIIGRMESENVRLVKENGMLREKCKSGERELKDRIRYLEEEIGTSLRKIDKLHKENETLTIKNNNRGSEIDGMNAKIHELEKENTRLHYELDKLKLQDVKNSGVVERAKELENENETLRAEVSTANEIIRKYNEEMAQMKGSLNSNEETVRELRSENKRYKSEIEETRKRLRVAEDKAKKTKENGKANETRVKELEAENKELLRKLENAQNVYNHFYSKNMENPVSVHYSENESALSITPESPPH